jgi:hypothetical protein
MNSDRNDRSDTGYERYPEEGYNSGYGTSVNEPYHYGGGRRSEEYRESNQNTYRSPRNLYGSRGGEYSDYGPGYSTANDFSGQEPVRGRLSGPERRHEDQDFRQQDWRRDRETYRRSDYPETYRSAMSGYMSEHVGNDRGRADYNQNPNEGNLYGNRYGMHQPGRQRNYERSGERGYMSEEDYDRGTPLYGGNIGYGRSYGSEMQGEGRHKGKGPRNYRRSDSRIREDINDRLTDDPMVDASEIDVAVQNCEVTLTGTVDDREAKRRAEDIAESVSGVAHVENRIKVRLPADTTPPYQ